MSQSPTSNLPSQIFLVGFMACGKSTVGPVLAAKLNRPFLDLDRVIETQVGCTIAELIGQEGEESFRRLETATLRAASSGELAVIAPGGGAITREENRRLMLSAYGITIWLDTPFELSWQRIVQDGATRPLAPDQETARARYEQRIPLYEQATLRIIIRADQSAEDIATNIVLSYFARVNDAEVEGDMNQPSLLTSPSKP